jgi:hypothetical protein
VEKSEYCMIQQHDMVEKEKLWRQESHHWLPEVRGKEGVKR